MHISFLLRSSAVMVGLLLAGAALNARAAAPGSREASPVSGTVLSPMMPSFPAPETGLLPLDWPQTQTKTLPTRWPRSTIHLAVDAGKAPSAAAPATQPSSRPAEQRQRYMGELVKVQGDDLILHLNTEWKGSRRLYIHTTPSMDIRLDGDPATPKDLKPGDSITIVTSPAAPMKVMAFSKKLFGIVVRVEGERLIVTPRESEDKSTEVTIATNEHTQIYDLNYTKDESGSPGRPNPKKIALHDIKPGMWMSVRPAKGVARTIMVEPAPATQAASTGAAKKTAYECYVGGHVARAGFYNLSPGQRLTVKKLIIAAGLEPADMEKGYVEVRRLPSPYDPGFMKEIELKALFSDPKADRVLHGGEIVLVH